MTQKHRILAVDDDPRNIRLVIRILSKKFILETVSSGNEALEILTSFRPDLILLDIIMPGIDGYETCRRIRKDDRFRFTKVILVSGNISVHDRLAGYEAGADDYITKPFVADELKAKIDVFMRLKRIEEIDQIKGDLLTLFSHETKTPLSGIIGFSALLKDNPDLDEGSRKCAGHIFSSGNQLLEFVRKATLLCDLKSGKQPEMRRGNAAEHYKKAVSTIGKNLFENDRAVFESSIPPDLELSADWNMLDLVLVYILSNAARYSPDGSVVTTTFLVSGSMCQIRVNNDGDGIDPEWIDKIFDTFAIFDVQHHQKGQGLSLAISKHVVELHAGSIEVSSTPGEGAEFTLNLPMTSQL
jgi:two-component system, sensor histidine kinase and response regulator